MIFPDAPYPTITIKDWWKQAARSYRFYAYRRDQFTFINIPLFAYITIIREESRKVDTFKV